jgi:hypothetical protein
MKRTIRMPIALLISLGVLVPAKAQAYDINAAINQLFKSDNATSQAFMPGSISNTFGINAGGFNLTNLFSPATLTALLPSSDFAKVLESIAQKNPSVTAATVNGEIKNTITKSVIASQGADTVEKERTITNNAATSSSLYTSNASTSYQSNLEASQALNASIAEVGGGINTLHAQNIDISKRIQVANEMKAEEMAYKLSQDRVQDDVNSRATSIKYTNSRVNDINPNTPQRTLSF